jgi:diguanylate cyclase (GGDEF)-like protein
LHVQHNGVPIGSVTASLGIAVFPQHGTTDEAVIKAADSALYQAKRDGRNRVCVGVRQSDTTYSQTEREV